MRTNVESGFSAGVTNSEGSFGILVRQISTLHKDLLAFQAKTEQRLDSLHSKVDKVGGRLHKIDSRLGAIERELHGLRADLPKIVRQAAKDALRGGLRSKS